MKYSLIYLLESNNFRDVDGIKFFRIQYEKFVEWSFKIYRWVRSKWVVWNLLLKINIFLLLYKWIRYYVFFGITKMDLSIIHVIIGYPQSLQFIDKPTSILVCMATFMFFKFCNSTRKFHVIIDNLNIFFFSFSFSLKLLVELHSLLMSNLRSLNQFKNIQSVPNTIFTPIFRLVCNKENDWEFI